MKKEINYPIKYAVLELKERGGYLAGYRDITQGFIASKCYVIESNIIYSEDGNYKITHKVVFPYRDIEIFKNSLLYNKQYIGIPEIPKYDACDRVYPVNVVSDLFDSYEEAKVNAISKNLEFKNNLLMEVPDFWSSKFMDLDWEKQLESLKQKYEQNLEVCNLFEELVIEATEDMNISSEEYNNDGVIKVLKPVRKLIK